MIMKFLAILVGLTAANGRYGKDLGNRFYVQAYGWDKGVRIEVLMREKTYLGFTLGEAKMWQTDMIIFSADGP